jgi:uncharacterized damage-inducible protein DinB
MNSAADIFLLKVGLGRSQSMGVLRVGMSYLRPGTKSQRLGITLVLAALWYGGPGLAQESNKISNFVRQALAVRSKEIITATTEMPADKFSFQPSPNEMTFAQLALHVAATNYTYCSAIGGTAMPSLPQMGVNAPKEKFVDQVKASFDFCTAALANLDDSNKSELLNLDGAQTSRAMAILTLTGAWRDHLTLTTNSLKLSGIVPSVANN